MTSKAPPLPARSPHPDSGSAPFTLSDADITSQRAVPRNRLPGTLGGRAAAAFRGAGAAPTDHDGPAETAAKHAGQKPGHDADG